MPDAGAWSLSITAPPKAAVPIMAIARREWATCRGILALVAAKLDWRRLPVPLTLHQTGIPAAALRARTAARCCTNPRTPGSIIANRPVSPLIARVPGAGNWPFAAARNPKIRCGISHRRRLLIGYLPSHPSKPPAGFSPPAVDVPLFLF